jgi:Ca2+-binding EF-hand superfamily protein
MKNSNLSTLFIDIDAAFKSFDTDGSGTISAAELKAVITACDPNCNHSDKEIKALLESLDKDGEY